MLDNGPSRVNAFIVLGRFIVIVAIPSETSRDMLDFSAILQPANTVVRKTEPPPRHTGTPSGYLTLISPGLETHSNGVQLCTYNARRLDAQRRISQQTPYSSRRRSRRCSAKEQGEWIAGYRSLRGARQILASPREEPWGEENPRSGDARRVRLISFQLMCIWSVDLIADLSYSTIWLARALPDDGHLTTLEISDKHAKVTHKSLVYVRLIRYINPGRRGQLQSSRCRLQDQFNRRLGTRDSPQHPPRSALRSRLHRR